MTLASPAAVPGSLAVPGAQTFDSGEPRFVLRGPAADDAWPTVAETEANGGVDPEHRTFLDAQLEAGDLVVDLAPGYGFLPLGVATHPVGAQALAVVPSPAVAASMRAALAETAEARADGAMPDRLLLTEAPDGLTETVAARIAEAIGNSSGRVFARITPDQCAAMGSVLASATRDDRLVAVLLDAPIVDAAAWRTAGAVLNGMGFVPHALAEREGEVGLFPAPDAPVGTPLVALHVSVLGDAPPPVDAPTVVEDPARVPPPQKPSEAPSATTLNFVAPFQRTGYGIVGANLLHALLEEGAAVSYFPMGAVDRALADVPGLDAAIAAQALFNASAPSVRLAQQFDLALHVGHGPRVGFPIFECTRFSTRARHHLKQQDALLVCSEWARGVVLANGVGHVPTHVVPLGVDRQIFHEAVKAVPGARGGDTVFMQVGKLEDRKGQRELLRAFEAAFTPHDPVRLVLLCHNPFLSADAFAHALAPFRQSPMAARITLHSASLPTQADVAAQMAAADCGVFCARAEGWNLEALEMLSMGKAIIATDYSGHTAFLTKENAHLVSVDALAPHETYGEWAAWEEAQHEQLVAHLRSVHSARQSGALALNAAGIATAEHHSWRRSAQALLRALS